MNISSRKHRRFPHRWRDPFARGAGAATALANADRLTGGGAVRASRLGSRVATLPSLTLLNGAPGPGWSDVFLHATITSGAGRPAGALQALDALRQAFDPVTRFADIHASAGVFYARQPRGCPMNAEARTVRASLTAARPVDWSERLAKTLLALALAGGVVWALAQGGLSSPVDLAQLFG